MSSKQKSAEHSTMKQFNLNGHSRPVRKVKYNHDGDMFFTCSDDKLIIAWSNFNAKKMGVYEGPSACKSLEVSRHTEHVIGAFGLDGVLIFEAETGKEITSFKADDKGQARYVELNYGDTELLVVTQGKDSSTIKIYDFDKILQKKKELIKVFNIDAIVTQASYGYLNEKLYVSTDKGKVQIYDLNDESLEHEEQVHIGKEREIFSFTFSKDFSMIATCSKDHTCKLLHPETLEMLKMYDKESPCRCAAISPLYDSEESDKFHILISGGQDAREVTTTAAKKGSFETRLYHIVYEEELAQIKGHFGPVHSIVFCPDGRGFVTASEDGTVRLQRFPLDYFER